MVRDSSVCLVRRAARFPVMRMASASVWKQSMIALWWVDRCNAEHRGESGGRAYLLI